MTHVLGHVDTSNDTSATYDGFVMNLATAVAGKSVQEREKSLRDLNHPPFGVARLGFGDESRIPFINNCHIPIEVPKPGNPGAEIGFHICLTSFDNGKYRAYAHDVIPYADHQEAEGIGARILKETRDGKSDRLEDYTIEEIEELQNHAVFTGRENLKRVLRQTAEYMKTPSFAVLYFDDNGNRLSEEGIKKRILEKVHLSRRRK